MDRCISSGTNIWLDFACISKIHLPFQLPYKYLMYHEAIEKEVLQPKDLADKLIEYGIEQIDISTEEFMYVYELKKKYLKLSTFDAIALSIAKNRNIPILTGDLALRNAAKKENVEVLGTLGIIDQLFDGGYIDKHEYKECLNNLLKHKERRLPESEIRNRLNSL